jgi:hypothetical protein
MAGLIHKASIKTVFTKLERDSPFTDNEKAIYSIKEQNLIRGIQLRDKEDKNQAIQTYHNYEIEGKRAIKGLNSSIRKYIKSQYPKIGGQQAHEVSEFEKNPPKRKIKLENKRNVDKYLTNKDNYFRNEKTYNRIKKAQEKYPDASLFELSHGVINSKASQEYRVKHGQNRNYTGRIITTK